MMRRVATEIVAATRLEQGLTPAITDAVVLAEIADLLSPRNDEGRPRQATIATTTPPLLTERGCDG